MAAKQCQIRWHPSSPAWLKCNETRSINTKSECSGGRRNATTTSRRLLIDDCFGGALLLLLLLHVRNKWPLDHHGTTTTTRSGGGGGRQQATGLEITRQSINLQPLFLLLLLLHLQVIITQLSSARRNVNYCLTWRLPPRRRCEHLWLSTS